MAFIEFISYVLLLIFWCFVLVLSLAIHCFQFNETDDWDKIYDKCTESTVKYQYVIRFLFGEWRKRLNTNHFKIKVDVMKLQQKLLTRFIITPKQLEKFTVDPESNVKIVKFFLFRSEPLENITNIALNHDSSGVIYVNSIEIQNVKSEIANIGYVNSEIHNLTEDKAKMVQQYPSGEQEFRLIEPSLRYSKTLNGIEYLVFIFMSINIILLANIYVIPCFENNETFCPQYKDSAVRSSTAGIASSLISSVVFIILISIYRYFIKTQYSIAFGEGMTGLVRIVYLLFVLTIGLICGSFGAYMASGHNHFKRSNYKEEIYWSIAVGIGVVIFVAIVLSALSVIGYLIGFWGSDTKTVKKVQSLAEVKTERNESTEQSESDKYFQSVKKVKSVSQYKGISKTPDKSPESAKSIKSTKGSRILSEDSNGDTYYKELWSNKKVKSVSQYKGIK